MSELTIYAVQEKVQDKTAESVRRIVIDHLPGQESRIDQLVRALLLAGLTIPDESAFEYRMVDDFGFESETFSEAADAGEAATVPGDRVQVRRTPSAWVDLA